MGTTANKWLCLSLVLGAIANAGCVPVYFYSPSTKPAAGRRIKLEDVAFIKPGITSRDEVISNLGAPTVDLLDLRILMYLWTDLKEYWVGAVPGLIFAGPRTGDHALLVAMDKNNRVELSGFDQPSGFTSNTVISYARKWAKAHQLNLPPVRTSFDPLPVPDGKAVLYIYRVKPSSSFSWSWSCLLFSASCLPARLTEPSWQFPVAVAIDNQYVTEMHDDTYVAIPVLPGRHEIVADPHPLYRYVTKFSEDDPSKRRPGTITIEVAQGRQYFLEVLSSSVFDSVNTSMTLRNESDAKPVIQTFRPVW